MTARQRERRQAGLEDCARVLGGQIGQEKVPAEVRSQRSAAAGMAVLERYGKDFYASLGRASAEKRRLKNGLSS